jgi:arylsulfatase
MGALATTDLGVPHTRGFISPRAATVAQILGAEGYQTSVAGKWHLTPREEQPESWTDRVNWPSGKGFQNSYAWLIGWTDQWNPEGVGREMMEGDRLAAGQRPPGYHVSEAIVSRAIDYLKAGFAANPNQPAFLYLPFGAGHYPIQAPKEYIDRYAGVYERGWDVLREERFARQKQLGIVPANAVLTPRDESIPAWDTLSADQKRLYAHYMAVYAGFMEHTDTQIGRLVAYLKESGRYDNTLVVFMSDNGPTTEGGQHGRFDMSGQVTTVDQMLARMDDIGGPTSSPTYPRGWAALSATPFQKWKNSPYAGGTRAPLIVTWPAGIKARGAIRSQFVELVDITPTALDIAGVTAPSTFAGVPQFEMAGRSIRATFDNASAATRSTQYFLLNTSRAIWHDGWKAIATHSPGTSFDDDVWELYHSREDYSEATNVAPAHPDRVAQLRGLWQSEAETHGALPLLEGGRGGRRGGAGRGGGGRGRGAAAGPD